MQSNRRTTRRCVPAVKAADFVQTLNWNDPFAVFAPANEAFAKLPAGTVDTLLKPENKAALVKTLTHHVVGQIYRSRSGAISEYCSVNVYFYWYPDNNRIVFLPFPRVRNKRPADRGRSIVLTHDRHFYTSHLNYVTESSDGFGGQPLSAAGCGLPRLHRMGPGRRLGGPSIR
jgi:hypothetical protein